MCTLPPGPMMWAWEKGADVRKVVSWGTIHFQLRQKEILTNYTEKYWVQDENMESNKRKQLMAK